MNRIALVGAAHDTDEVPDGPIEQEMLNKIESALYNPHMPERHAVANHHTVRVTAGKTDSAHSSHGKTKHFAFEKASTIAAKKVEDEEKAKEEDSQKNHAEVLEDLRDADMEAHLFSEVVCVVKQWEAKPCLTYRCFPLRIWLKSTH